MRAAIDEFLEHGYVGARVESITSKAGVGYGTFYRYFGNKVALLRELADEVYDATFEQYKREPDPDLPVIERTFAGILTVFRVMLEHRNAVLVLDDAVGAEPELAGYVRALQTRNAVRWAEKLGANTYRPVGDRNLISHMTSDMGIEMARLWLRQTRNRDITPADVAGIENIARLSTLMSLAVIDPLSLGISEDTIEEIMYRLPAPPAI